MLCKQCQIKLALVCLSNACSGVFWIDQFSLIFSRRYRIDYLCVNTHKGIKITNVFVGLVVVIHTITLFVLWIVVQFGCVSDIFINSFWITLSKYITRQQKKVPKYICVLHTKSHQLTTVPIIPELTTCIQTYCAFEDSSLYYLLQPLFAWLHKTELN